jgi:hypothetical protein
MAPCAEMNIAQPWVFKDTQTSRQTDTKTDLGNVARDTLKLIQRMHKLLGATLQRVWDKVNLTMAYKLEAFTIN